MKSLFILFFHSFTVSSIIILLAHPAEVGRFVVAGVAVDVIHGIADLRVRVRTPRLSHETADEKMACLPKAREAHPIITFVICKRRQEPRIRVFQCFYASKVADKILAVVALYGLPGFTW